MDKAQLYVDSVKEAFRDEPEKYDELVNIAKDAKDHKIDEASAITRMTQLMKGHQNLLVGLRDFVPEAEITIPPEAEQLTMSDAETFLNKVKTRFEIVDAHVYKSVLRELKMYKDRKKSLKEVQEEVLSLLYNHHDLTEEFSRFLPKH